MVWLDKMTGNGLIVTLLHLSMVSSRIIIVAGLLCSATISKTSLHVAGSIMSLSSLNGVAEEKQCKQPKNYQICVLRFEFVTASYTCLCLWSDLQERAMSYPLHSCQLWLQS